MPKAIKGNASRKPPDPSASHSDIDNWTQRQVPHLQPIVTLLDESIRATIPGLQYAVKWKRPYYGLPELGWIIEMAAYDVSVNVVCLGGADFDDPPPLGNDRPDPLRQGDHPGGGTATRAAQVDRGGEPHAGLWVKGVVHRTPQEAHCTRIAGDIERVREVPNPLTRDPGPTRTDRARSGR